MKLSRVGYSTIAAILFNIICSITLIIANKRLVMLYNFNNMTLLTGIHFLMSFLLCAVMIVTGMLQYKSVNNYSYILRVAIGSLLSVVCMNYCLAYSSVGFYQVSKLFCIPTILLLESVFNLKQQRITRNMCISLVCITVGMYFVITEEIRVHYTGIIWAVLGITITSATQTFFGPLKKELALDSLQLLFHTSPILTLGSVVSIPLFDNMNSLINYDFNAMILLNIVLTSVIAAFFNASNYLVLSEVTPMTYNILGHIKTIAIVYIGMLLFGSIPSLAMIMGMTLAIIGVIIYSIETQYTSSKDNAVKSSDTAPDIERNNKTIRQHKSINNRLGVALAAAVSNKVRMIRDKVAAMSYSNVSKDNNQDITDYVKITTQQ